MRVVVDTHVLVRALIMPHGTVGPVLLRLRGSDAVYAAVALRFGSTLITLDREQRERVAEALTARYPAEVLAETA